MRSPKAKRYTVDNNLGGTHNVMCAVVESELDIHVVHLGTMGVYGYGTSGKWGVHVFQVNYFVLPPLFLCNIELNIFCGNRWGDP